MSRISFLILVSLLAIHRFTLAGQEDQARNPIINELEIKNDAGITLTPDFGVSATFSIAAVDPETGVCGAAVASKYPDVGRVVAYARAGLKESRSFRMGFTGFPHDVTVEAVMEMRSFLEVALNWLTEHFDAFKKPYAIVETNQ